MHITDHRAQICALFATTALLAGCSNPVAFVTDKIDPHADCFQPDKNAPANPPQRLRDLQSSTHGIAVAQELSAIAHDPKLTYCDVSPLPKSDVGEYRYYHSKNLLVVNRSTAPERITARFINAAISRGAHQRNWTAQLNPQDGLIFARALDSHAITSVFIDITGVPKQSEAIVDHLDSLGTHDTRQVVSAYRNALKSKNDSRDVFSSVFQAAINQRIKNMERDREFLGWYNNELNPRTIPTVGMCFNFSSGGMEMCATTKTVYPSPDLGKISLTPELLVQLSEQNHHNGNYLDSDLAASVLSTMRESIQTPPLTQALSDLNTKLGKCCDGRSSKGTLGIGIRRGSLGLTLF